jgi:predicted nucleic acid-binding Zn ribbon protein
MAATLPPHSHCFYCDDPIPEGEQFCSEDCKNALRTKRKKESRRMLFFYVGAAIAFMIIGFVATM